MSMNVFRWISLAWWVVLLAVWVLWYVKGKEHPRRWALFGGFLLSMLLESVAALFPDTLIGWSLLILAALGLMVCLVLMVQGARATWRGEMEKVKHL